MILRRGSFALVLLLAAGARGAGPEKYKDWNKSPEFVGLAVESEQKDWKKIASNLYFLREHPDIAPGLRRVIGKVHDRWLLLAQTLPSHAATAPARLEALTAPHELH